MSLLRLSIATTDYDHFRDFRLGLVKASKATQPDCTKAPLMPRAGECGAGIVCRPSRCRAALPALAGPGLYLGTVPLQ